MGARVLRYCAVCVCAGALLAVGVLNCGVQHENDPAYALLYDFVEKPDATIRIGAIMGLGLAYAGACDVCIPSLSRLAPMMRRLHALRRRGVVCAALLPIVPPGAALAEAEHSMR